MCFALVRFSLGAFSLLSLVARASPAHAVVLGEEAVALAVTLFRNNRDRLADLFRAHCLLIVCGTGACVATIVIRSDAGMFTTVALAAHRTLARRNALVRLAHLIARAHDQAGLVVGDAAKPTTIGQTRRHDTGVSVRNRLALVVQTRRATVAFGVDSSEAATTRRLDATKKRRRGVENVDAVFIFLRAHIPLARSRTR